MFLFIVANTPGYKEHGELVDAENSCSDEQQCLSGEENPSNPRHDNLSIISQRIFLQV
jgi:hypothetical protein